MKTEETIKKRLDELEKKLKNELIYFGTPDVYATVETLKWVLEGDNENDRH